jgi:hypothetical protein
MKPRIPTDEDIKKFIADMKAISKEAGGAPEMNRKKLRVMSDIEVEDFAQRLIDAGKNGEAPQADVSENEMDAGKPIDVSAEHVAIFLKKKAK